MNLDGIDSNAARLKPSAEPLTLRGWNRACHTFIRSIPELQWRSPNDRFVIVGQTTGVSYGVVYPNGEWKDESLSEIQGPYSHLCVHFTGQLPYSDFLQLLQLSQAHVFLTYPLLLSWGQLEAVSKQ